MIDARNCDYREIINETADLYFDLAICDFEYGIDVGNMAFLKETKTTVKQKNGKRLNGNNNKVVHDFKNWDKEPPKQEYFESLKRVAKEQILFGIEYVNWDGIGKGRIKWDKGFSEKMSFKRYEIAYCSSIDSTVELPLLWAGMMQAKSLLEPMTQQGNKKLNQKRIHPTEKPILLYIKLLLDYAQKGFKILDTHGGSFSHAIAVEYLNRYHNMDLELVICEKDKGYFDMAYKRLKTYQSQLTANL